MSAEEWRPVPGVAGRYDVSSHGRIRNAQGRVLSPYTDSVGYRIADMHHESGRVRKRLHTIVAAIFLGPRPDGMDVRHLNGDKLDNRVENLAYGTRSQNNLDAVSHGTNANTRKTHCPKGHPYDEANTRRPPSRPNARICRRCESDRQKAAKPWLERSRRSAA